MNTSHDPRWGKILILLTAALAFPIVGQSQPSIRINDVSVTEGPGGAAVFTLSINENPENDRPLTVRAATQNGSALAGQDYVTRAATITFWHDGPRSQNFSVSIIDNNTVEPTETFNVNLTNPVNGRIADSRGVGTILDNDRTTNRSPTCAIDSPPGPVTIVAGGTVSYASTVTDPDGDPVTIAWTFPGGTPASSSAGDPGLVRYGAAGSFTTTLGASDNRGGSCTPQSRVITVTQQPATNTSINSTSSNSPVPVTGAVTQQPKVTGGNFSLLAVNDLGMHCADLDARIVNILPPFQVMLAQLIQKGTTPTLNPAGWSVSYSAASNPNDPILTQTGVLNGLRGDGTTFKSNFAASFGNGAYDPFYPGAVTAPANWHSSVTPDLGLPVPDIETLLIGPDGRVGSGDESLELGQQAMPGISSPFSANGLQSVLESYGSKPVFPTLPFGYVAENVNLMEATGIPFAPFDDQGRENPYPLVRVQASSGTTVVATSDVVLPVSGETSCSNCHAAPADDPANNRSTLPTDALTAASLPLARAIQDPDPNMPDRVSLEWATDINILRLHDLLHGPSYATKNGTQATQATPCTINSSTPNGSVSCLTNKALVQGVPIVCQTCHYTPALDLAQVGPLGGPAGTNANGRNQLIHQTNSRVMHNRHGQFTTLFPVIPAPIQNPTTGDITNQAARQTALEQNCYQCHPGKNTKCLRGAMFNGGVLCSDCHGSLTQIGNDFSRNVSSSSTGANAFILASDFYTNAATPRVPWANEPGCGSCHTGDGVNNLASSANVVANLIDSNGVKDGLRLRQAFHNGDGNAKPIVPTNKRFAEPVVPATFNGFANPGAGNPKLYRMSTGHGGVMCEGCHGSTHAEWPVAGANVNDNLLAIQLQGHAGFIMECSACHLTSGLPGNTQGGPHGMHLVNDSRWLSAHQSAAETQNRQPGGGTCGACHGSDHLGTVLSRVPVTRNLSGRTVQAGQPVPCNLCHSLNTSFESG